MNLWTDERGRPVKVIRQFETSFCRAVQPWSVSEYCDTGLVALSHNGPETGLRRMAAALFVRACHFPYPPLMPSARQATPSAIPRVARKPTGAGSSHGWRHR
jgi:hypothetical protein